MSCLTCSIIISFTDAILNRDLAETFPRGTLADHFSQDWIGSMIKETKSNKEFSQRTTGMARWAKQQVTLQAGMSLSHTARTLKLLHRCKYWSSLTPTKSYFL